MRFPIDEIAQDGSTAYGYHEITLCYSGGSTDWGSSFTIESLASRISDLTLKGCFTENEKAALEIMVARELKEKE